MENNFIICHNSHSVTTPVIKIFFHKSRLTSSRSKVCSISQSRHNTDNASTGHWSRKPGPQWPVPGSGARVHGSGSCHCTVCQHPTPAPHNNLVTWGWRVSCRKTQLSGKYKNSIHANRTKLGSVVFVW